MGPKSKFNTPELSRNASVSSISSDQTIHASQNQNGSNQSSAPSSPLTPIAGLSSSTSAERDPMDSTSTSKSSAKGKKRSRGGNLLGTSANTTSTSQPSTPTSSVRPIKSNASIPISIKNNKNSLSNNLQAQDLSTSSSLSGSPHPLPSSSPTKPSVAPSLRSNLKNPSGGISSLAMRGNWQVTVESAFDLRAKGDFGEFNKLLKYFQLSNTPEPWSKDNLKTLSSILSALNGITTRINKEDKNNLRLINTILALPWYSSTEKFRISWSRFFHSLCSARPEWLKPVLKSIVTSFNSNPFHKSPFLLPKVEPRQFNGLILFPPDGSEIEPTREEIYKRLHGFLKRLNGLVPLMPRILTPLMIQRIPNTRRGRSDWICYLSNILKVGAYCDETREAVLAAIADRAMWFDVRISSTQEDEEGEEDKEDQQDGMKTDIQIGQDPEGDQENAGFHHLLNKTLQQQRQEEEEREKDPFLTKIGDVHDEDSDDEAMAESNDDLPQMDGIDAEGGDQNQPQQQQNQIDLDAIDSEDDGEDDDSDDIDSQAKKLGCDKAQRGFLQKVEKDGKLAQYQSKLDGIMKTVFDFLSSQEDLFKELTRSFQSLTAMMQSNSNGETLQNLEKCKINLEKIKSSRIATFNTLMMIYRRIILKTHQSRHVQFLLFWYSSLDDSFADELLGNFVIGAFGESMNDDNNLNSNSNPSLILQDHQRISTNPDFQLQNDMALRRSYCAYLASFCSRAKHCSSDYLQHVTQLLVEELDSHLRKHYELKGSNIGQGKNEGDRIHESWYAIAQAVMYIFCFRWKDLRKDAGKDRDLDQATGYVKITDDEDDPMKGLPPLDQNLLSKSDTSFTSSSSSSSSSKSNVPSLTQLSPMLRPLDSNNQENDSISRRMREPSENALEEVGGIGGLNDWHPSLSKFHRSIFSPLNPLAHCHATVVDQFCEVAHETGYAFCWTKVEQIRRASRGENLSRASSTNSDLSKTLVNDDQQETSGSNQAARDRIKNAHLDQQNNHSIALRTKLDSFFPFDPYTLEGSRNYIDAIYNDWNDVAPQGLRDSDSEEETEDDDDDEDKDKDEDEDDSDDESNENKRIGGVVGPLEIPGSKPTLLSSSGSTGKKGDGKKKSSGRSKTSHDGGASYQSQEDGQVAKSLEAMSFSYSPN